jgi:translation initiation factor 2 subunit 1
MMASSMDKEIGLKALNDALVTIKEEITTRKGRLVVKQEPHAVSEKEEASLAEEMKRLELANTEVDGDDDGSGDDE